MPGLLNRETRLSKKSAASSTSFTPLFSSSMSLLREKCQKMAFFLVRILLYSVQRQENVEQKKLRIWTLSLLNSSLSFNLHWSSFVIFARFGTIWTIQKTWKIPHGGVLKACNFTRSSTSPWMFFTFLKFYKWFQIAQHITFDSSLFWPIDTLF